MFDANKLNRMARRNILDLAKQRISVGQKMAEGLDWDKIETRARSGLWNFVLRPRELSYLYHLALNLSSFTPSEVKEIVKSTWKENKWMVHFNRFAEELERMGFEVGWNWERLNDSQFAYDGRNDFSVRYESKRNLWHPDRYWGRPTVMIRWGKSLQLDDAIQLLTKEEAQDGDFGDDFLARF